MHKKKGVVCSKRKNYSYVDNENLIRRRRGSSKRNYECKTEKPNVKRLEKAIVDTIHNQGNFKPSR